MTDTRYLVHRLIVNVLVEEGGSSAIVNRPTSVGLDLPGPADYLVGIRAARKVAYAAEAAGRDYARHARSEGHTWVQIAAALGITDEQSNDPAVDAFLWVAPSPSMAFDTITTSWECASCGARIVDHGPYGGHPDDVEDGHAQGCGRHDTEVREYLHSVGWDK